MADPTRNQGPLGDAKTVAAAARDRGMEQLEGAKGQLAEGAERMAAAVERTADELEGEGDEAISGYGHSLANLMRQLAGGLRERDIEQFAGELGALARRNPGMFLAGSVAIGFGVARFFKARSTPLGHDYGSRERDYERRYGDGDGGTFAARGEMDEESLDLSGNPVGVARRDDDGGALRDPSPAATAGTPDSALRSSSAAATAAPAAARGDDTGPKSRAAGKSKPKSQRAASDAAGGDTTETGGKDQ
jgi:hypothetical protein